MYFSFRPGNISSIDGDRHYTGERESNVVHQ